MPYDYFDDENEVYVQGQMPEDDEDPFAPTGADAGLRPGVMTYDNVGDFIKSGGAIGGGAMPQNQFEAALFQDLYRQHMGDSSSFDDYVSMNFGPQSPDYLEEIGNIATQDQLDLYSGQQDIDWQNEQAQHPTRMGMAADEHGLGLDLADNAALRALDGPQADLSQQGHDRSLETVRAGQEAALGRNALMEDAGYYTSLANQADAQAEYSRAAAAAAGVGGDGPGIGQYLDYIKSINAQVADLTDRVSVLRETEPPDSEQVMELIMAMEGLEAEKQNFIRNSGLGPLFQAVQSGEITPEQAEVQSPGFMELWEALTSWVSGPGSAPIMDEFATGVMDVPPTEALDRYTIEGI